MAYSAHDLMTRFPELLEFKTGSLEKRFSIVSPAEAATEKSLVFAAEAKHLNDALAGPAAVIVTSKKLLGDKQPAEKTILLTAHPGLAYSKIATALFYKDPRNKKRTHQFHPKASISETAKIGKDTIVEAGAVIEDGAEIGANCFIGANSVIETGAKIGDNSTIWPLVFIGSHCQLGHHVQIYPNSTIGKDGFGFVRDQDGKQHRLPQLGIVKLGNHVEIGSSCTIDRAAFSETIISDGTKLDNHCHIAHNCKVGKNGVITAGIIVAGSSTIGANFMTGGRVSITDHVHICDGVMLGGLSGVANDITKPGAYGGYPVQPLKDYLRTTANFLHLTKMRKDLAKIMKHLGLASEEEQ